MGVLECEYTYTALLAYMTSVSAMYSHAKADIEKGNAALTTMYFDALAAIPYLTGGKTGKDVMEEDRMRAIEAYRQMKNAALKKKDVNAGPGRPTNA